MTATLIDVILTTAGQTTTTLGTISPPITDHLPIYAIFDTAATNRHTQTMKTLSRNRYEKHKDKILTTVKNEIEKTKDRSEENTNTKILDIQLAI